MSIFIPNNLDLVPAQCDAILGRQYIVNGLDHRHRDVREAVLAHSALVGEYWVHYHIRLPLKIPSLTLDLYSGSVPNVTV